MYMKHIFPLASSSNRAQHSALFRIWVFFTSQNFFFFCIHFDFLKNYCMKIQFILMTEIFGTHLILHSVSASLSLPHSQTSSKSFILDQGLSGSHTQPLVAVVGGGDAYTFLLCFTAYPLMFRSLTSSRFLFYFFLIALLTTMAISPLPSSCGKLFYVILQNNISYSK